MGLTQLEVVAFVLVDDLTLEVLVAFEDAEVVFADVVELQTLVPESSDVG